MPVQIVKRGTLVIHGFSGRAINKNYAQTGMMLGDRMWKIVRSNNLANDGINYWVYDRGDEMFVGTALKDTVAKELMRKEIPSGNFASCIHRGPVKDIKVAYEKMKQELDASGVRYHLPFLEIYGHWTPDESKFETEILFSIGGAEKA